MKRDGLQANGWTEIFIYPGYQFKMNMGPLITNFHSGIHTFDVGFRVGWKTIMAAMREAVKDRFL